MKIVVLDGYTLNPGDLSWDGLKALGDCVIHDRTSPDLVVARARDAAIILTNKTLVTRNAIQQLPELRCIGVLATGHNIVDAAAARERNIPVLNVPAYSTQSVAQLTFALLLELAMHVGHHSEQARAGRWSAGPDFCFWDHPLIELEGLTFGIVGFGRNGQAVAEVARAFGMNVIAHTPRPPRALPVPVKFTELESLLRASDVVSLHCPLTAQTRGLLGADRLALMKPTAFLLNTSRGPLIDEAALAAALNAGRIAGAGLDVLAVEPPAPDNPLLHAKNCVLTPHFGWATFAARKRLMQVAVDNVAAFLAGKPQNVVN